MPNRLPPCPVCGPKYRHGPEACPKANGPTQGIRNGLAGISAALLTLKVAREELREVVGMLKAEGNR